MKNSTTKKFDVLGISSAVLCLIHCLVFPLITILPIGLSHNHWIDLLFASIGIYAVAKITKNIDSKSLRILLWSSILLITVCVLITLVFHYHSDFIYLGAFGLILGHLINFKNHKH